MSVVAWTKKILEAALFYEIWDAMKVTFKHMFHRPITFQYPREQRTIPDGHRGALDYFVTTMGMSVAWVVTSAKRPALPVALK